MARRRFGRRGKGGGDKLFGLGTKGLLSLGVLGAVAGGFFANEIAGFIPIDLPAKPYLAAFAVGGPAGVGVKIAKDLLLGGGLVGAGGTGGIVIHS